MVLSLRFGVWSLKVWGVGRFGLEFRVWGFGALGFGFRVSRTGGPDSRAQLVDSLRFRI